LTILFFALVVIFIFVSTAILDDVYKFYGEWAQNITLGGVAAIAVLLVLYVFE